MVKNYIYKQVANHSLSQGEAKQLLLELKDKTEAPDKDGEIAVIGMAGRFPVANNIDEYWKNIRGGKVCIGDIPEGRKKDIEDFFYRFYYERLVKNNAIKDDGSLHLEYLKSGYMYEIDKFDAAFFGIPPREAKAMDPGQRMFLEVAYEAMENAGYGGSKLYGTNTGIFVGLDNVPGMVYKQIAASDPMVVTGTWPGILASRVSYTYNFHGPCMVIDTACSSGLVCIHSACNALKNEECDIAIAGGLSGFGYDPVKFNDEPNELESVESKDRIVRSFDKKANGTAWGEGIGAVILKPLNKALADGDVIHAVIKGSAINNDGASNGITAPDAGAQESLLLNAWKKAKVHPETIQYVEAHGTGTVLGDPIEIKALTNAFKSSTDKKQFCGIGSVKTNIGHLVAASGVASLIKVVMMLKNKLIPASLNFTEPNPYINFCDSPVYLNDRLTPWEKGEAPRRAGINSFGFSGTNCHVILEEAPQQLSEDDNSKTDVEIFTISARSQNILKKIIEKYNEEFSAKEFNIRDLCYTASTGRGHYTHRLALLVKDYKDLKEKIKYLSKTDLNDINKFGVYYGEHKIVPDNKTIREKGEIVEGERRKLSRAAASKLEELVKDYGYAAAAELCDLYIKGAMVEWEGLYSSRKMKKVSLPVYPLERVRYWYEEKNESRKLLKGKTLGSAKEFEHPLLDRCLADSIFQGIFATDFSVDRHWILSEHIILGSHIIPGTGCIEIAMEACKKYYGDSSVELRDIVFLSPCIVEKGEVKEVHTIVIKEEDHLKFTIASKSTQSSTFDPEETWIKHAEGTVYRKEASTLVCNIDELYNRLQSEHEKLQLIESNDENAPIQVGEHWTNHTFAAVGKNEVLVDMELPDELTNDQHLYTLHPSLLDNAVNVVSQIVGKGLYLPFYYKSFKLNERMPKKFYSYITIKKDSVPDPETIRFDIVMMTKEGKAFAVIEDYKIKKVSKNELKPRETRDTAYFELGWVSEEPKGNIADIGGEVILVFKNNGDISDDLVQRLRTEGSRVIEVETASEFRKISEDRYTIKEDERDYQCLLAELDGKKPARIIHLSGIAGTSRIEDIKRLEEAQNKGVYSLFNLTKALIANKYKDTDIILIADYANEITKDESTINPQNAALFGLARIVPLEYPNLKCRCIDIDDSTKIESIITEIKSNESAKRVGYRNNRRYVEEFGKRELIEKPGAGINIKEQGVYVITGGTGGLGLEVGKYLASRNKVNIAFVNRSKLLERDKWDSVLEEGKDIRTCRAVKAIREMESLGAEVVCLNADVANIDDMKKVLNSLRNRYGVINGVVHCAGVAGKGFIMNKDRCVFESVVAPKVQGTWILDKLTEDDSLDFFIMFSSITSIFGVEGQGDYTAANSYMDSYAAYRHMRGKKAVALNWPAWKETGMAVDFGVDDKDSVVKAITTENALRYLDEIMNCDTTKLLPGELNYRKLAEVKEELPFKLSEQIKGILKKRNMQTDNKEVHQENTAKAVIKGRGDVDYNETESRLAQIWSQVLEVGEVDIFESFSSMGGDSMMAIQLLKQIEKVYPGIIDVSDIFTYPSVQQMAEYIDQKRGVAREEKETPAQDGLSDETLKNLLDNLESGETSIENVLGILDSHS
ncbi:MAG: SDR family NAD(P)-dependent oxidoreductase [Clostridia bacterium]|nr:SDR family NAD(P)-dependent oxidoreductase [Clostridia bacterium]